jgi:hypothetical protein
MAELGRLRWIMDLDTTRFESGLRRARSSIAGVGAALAAMGAGRAIGRSVETAERLVQGSQAAGIGIVPLQELEFAGGQAGMQPGEMGASLTAFSRNLALLRQGRGPLRKIAGRRTQGILRQMAGAPDTEAALGVLSGAVAGLPAGLGGALAEKAGFGSQQAYELLAGGPGTLASERARYYQYNRPLQAPEAENLKRGGDIYEAMTTAISNGFTLALGDLTTRWERWLAALDENTLATKENTRSGTVAGP